MMNNEPVAWMMVNRENTSAYLTFDKPTRDMKISHEPHELYTHPAELTYADGIEECAQRAEAYAYMSPNFTALAEELRAILRKAQEK